MSDTPPLVGFRLEEEGEVKNSFVAYEDGLTVGELLRHIREVRGRQLGWLENPPKVQRLERHLVRAGDVYILVGSISHGEISSRGEIQTTTLAEVKFLLDPLEPCGEFLKEDLVLPLPVGYLLNDYHHLRFADVRHYDKVISAGIFTWMRGWSVGGEAGLIHRNDGLLSVIDYAACLTYRLRDKHDKSTTLTSRSDATFGFAGCALVQVEEKDHDSLELAIADLRRKFQWIPHFADLPFVFGIAITRTEFGILAMKRCGTMDPLFYSPLSNDQEKWDCLLASVNLARVLRHFIVHRLFLSIEIPLNTWVDRGHGKSLRLGMRFVEVAYSNKGDFARLCQFYDAVRRAEVPNIESLITNGLENAIVSSKMMFRLRPMGLSRCPRDVHELKSALNQIIGCIFALHKVGYCHCDIRWSNIVYANGQWYLIDCTLATQVNDKKRLAFVTSVIKEDFIFDRNIPWGPRQDFFQIGKLIHHSENGLHFATLRDYLVSSTDEIIPEQTAQLLHDVILT